MSMSMNIVSFYEYVYEYCMSITCMNIVSFHEYSMSMSMNIVSFYSYFTMINIQFPFSFPSLSPFSLPFP